MALNNRKILDTDVTTKGVVAAPNVLNGSAQQNKAIFDRLIREIVKERLNALIDDLTAVTAAGELGASVEGVTGNTVQAVMAALKAEVDTKAGDAGVTAKLALKADKADTDLHFKAIGFDAATGTFTFTRENGTSVEVDTALEKVAVNFTYDATTEELVLTLADGSTQRISLAALISAFDFVDSSTVAFGVSGGTVTAQVKAGSITDEMLSTALVDYLEGLVADAESSEIAADGSAQSAASAAASASGSASTAASAAASARSSAAAAASASSSASTAASAANSRANRAVDAAAAAEDSSSAAARAAASAAVSAASASGAVTRYPYIDGESGNWMVWDASQGAFVDTGVPATGADGATFTPSVSEDGIISWTNDKGLPNPTARNITGPQGKDGEDGEDGHGLVIMGLYATLAELETAHPTAAVGDAYAVGTADSNEIYVWDGSTWVNLGSLSGPEGQKGDIGPAGPNLINGSTSTTLTGVLRGNGSNVTVQAVDTTPTSGSGNLITSGGVQAAIVSATAAIKAASDLANYYTKSQTYTQAEVNALVSAIPKFAIEVVQTLPTQGISDTTVYLVPSSSGETQNLYDEYIHTTGGWEKLGTQTVDLTGYATEAWVTTQLGSYLKTTDIAAWAKAATKPTYTKSEVGLGNVDNTSDASKPISTAQQAALDGKVDTADYNPAAKTADMTQAVGKDANGLLWTEPSPNVINSGTTTTLTGVLMGVGGAVGVKSVDATPTSDSDNLITSGAVYNALSSAKPKVGTIALSGTWSGSGPYSKTVTVTGATVTANSKVDLQPAATALNNLISAGVTALWVENNSGTLTAYALGAAPSAGGTVQCTVTEVRT